MTTSEEEVVEKEVEEHNEDKDIEEGFEFKTRCIEKNQISAKYEELLQKGKDDFERVKGTYKETCRDFVVPAYRELRSRDIAPEMARKIVTYDARQNVGWAYKTISDVIPDEAKNEKMAELGRHGAEIKKLKRGLGSENMDKAKIKHIASLGGKGKAQSFRDKEQLEEEVQTLLTLEIEIDILERIVNKAKEVNSRTVKLILKGIEGEDLVLKDYQLSEPKRTELI
jgi:hypothetical protein